MELHARSQTETWYLPRACSLWHEQPHYCEFLTADISLMHTYVFLVKFLASVEYQRTADRPIVVQCGWRLRGKSTQTLVEIVKSGTCLLLCFRPYWVCSGRTSLWQKVYAEAFLEQRYPQHGLHHAHLALQERRIFRLWLLYQLLRKPTSLFAHRPMSFIRFQPYPSKL